MAHIPSPRVCKGCGKPKGTVCFLGEYWHPTCFRKHRRKVKP